MTNTTVWFWHKNRQADQRNKKCDSVTKQKVYGNLIYDRTGTAEKGEKDTFFNKWSPQKLLSRQKKWDPISKDA